MVETNDMLYWKFWRKGNDKNRAVEHVALERPLNATVLCLCVECTKAMTYLWERSSWSLFFWCRDTPKSLHSKVRTRYFEDFVRFKVLIRKRSRRFPLAPTVNRFLVEYKNGEKVSVVGMSVFQEVCNAHWIWNVAFFCSAILLVLFPGMTVSEYD